MSKLLAFAPCWHPVDWMMASEYSVQSADITRAQARQAFEKDTGLSWTEIGVWKRYIHELDRQSKYEWWVESCTDGGWDEHPDVVPDDWTEPYDDYMPVWEFVSRDHAEAIPVWICGELEAGAPRQVFASNQDESS
jgi:hypothetical protein